MQHTNVLRRAGALMPANKPGVVKMPVPERPSRGVIVRNAPVTAA